MTQVLVADFDGTIISKNTFPRWVWHLIGSSLKTFRWRRATVLLVLTARRKLGAISHPDYKRRVALLRPSRAEVERFAARVASWADRDVVSELTASPGILIVATAAIGDYVRRSVELVGLCPDDIITSGFDGEGTFVDNVREVKAASVASRLVELGARERWVSVYTDHVDDLPLAASADYIVLCSSDPTTVDRFKELDSELRVFGAAPRLAEGMRTVDLSARDDFEVSCRALSRVAATHIGRPEFVVGIATGGAEVSEVVAASLEVPLAVVRAQRPSTAAKNGRGVKTLLGRLPSWMAWQIRRIETVLSEARFAMRGSSPSVRVVEIVSGEHLLNGESSATVLVVDDAVDSGETLTAVVEHLQRLMPRVRLATATLTVSYRNPLVLPDAYLYRRALLRGPWSLDASDPTR